MIKQRVVLQPHPFLSEWNSLQDMAHLLMLLVALSYELAWAAVRMFPEGGNAVILY
jgi:hypothetical protein